MKPAKLYIALCAALLSITQLHAQKQDSIETLFKSPRSHVHYSYLQMEYGYTGFVFNNTFLNGSGYDLIGAVFNDDVQVTIGFDQCSNPSRINYSNITSSPTVQTYSDFYIKAEPMLFPEKLFNFAMPIKFCTSVLTYPTPSPTSRRRTRGFSFFSVTAGAEFFVNVFRSLSMGTGINYRLAFGSSSSVSSADRSNFSFSILLRVKIFTRATGRKFAARHNDYYAPTNRFQ